MQQARNLYNVRKRDKGILSARAMLGLLYTVNRYSNKEWERLVPAAAVTPALQVAIAIIGPKAFVAGYANTS